MSSFEPDDTNLTEEEFDRRYAAGRDVHVFASRNEFESAVQRPPGVYVVEPTENVSAIVTTPDDKQLSVIGVFLGLPLAEALTGPDSRSGGNTALVEAR